METVVMKFGGSALTTPASFHHVAALVAKEQLKKQRVVVVVSAMAKMTDNLIGLAKEVHKTPPRREYDMLVSAGERISIALLAMALAANNREAVSFTGSQSGMITDENHSNAKIIDVRPFRLIPPLKQEKCVIVAGFQGVSKSGQITTLGRGGSDATAVALGIALQAREVLFFKDVTHIFEKDPKKFKTAKPLNELNYEEALEVVARSGGQVLQPRCIKLAHSHGIPLKLCSFFKEARGTRIYEEKQQRPKTPTYEKHACKKIALYS